MLQIQYSKEAGRELMVSFCCSRCGKKDVMPYDEAMPGEHYGYLHNSKIPEGWRECHSDLLFCPRCYAQYQQFMRCTNV